MKAAARTTPAPNELGALLRRWRDIRGRSQLDLSLDTGISQKQLSFVESGRSTPSRQTLMSIARVLDIPLRDRNTLFLAAGYAPVYADGAWDSEEMQSITKALQRVLAQHEPYPAVVMDRYWNVLLTNDSAPRFFGCFIDLAARQRSGGSSAGGERNILHLMFDPAGMRPFVANWAETAKSLIERVTREAVGRVLDAKTKALLADLLAYPDVKPQWTTPIQLSFMPVIPLSFVHKGTVLNYFSMVTTVGTPQTVAAQELRLECMFPADQATEAEHMRLMAQAPAPKRAGSAPRT
ncbi:MAG TPA: helix-turn-helix transcriptional regulator [Candidatus Cybelea sp.]|nr:helix-turn-helix transcriptional regulator [Candidatus Cybelea sp.]